MFLKATAYALLLLAGMLLSACAARAPLPQAMPQLAALPLQLHVQRLEEDARQDWLLVIQRENAALRWSLLDPMGLPLARQLLEDGSWHNDGLLPPNPEARELFAALLFALTPEAQLPQAYADSDWRVESAQRSLRQAGRMRWQISYRQPLHFELRMADGLRYRLAPLQAEPQP